MSVLVVTEQHGGKWHKMSWETLAAGQQIAASLGTELSVLVLGSDTASIVPELAAHRVNRVLTADHELLAAYSPDGYTRALEQVIENAAPRLVLFPHTYFVRDYGPKLATRLNPAVFERRRRCPCRGRPHYLRPPTFPGQNERRCDARGEPPYFASIQSGAFHGDALRARRQPRADRKRRDRARRRRHPNAPRRMVSRVEGRSRSFLGRHHRLGGPRDQGPREYPHRRKLAEALGAKWPPRGPSATTAGCRSSAKSAARDKPYHRSSISPSASPAPSNMSSA